MATTRHRSLIAGLIFAGVAIVGFFGLRAFFAFREFRRHGPPPHLAEMFTQQPTETDVELIREWMTIPYIGRTYQVHPKIIFEALRIPPRDNEEKSLLQLNDEFFPNQLGIVIELVKATVHANQPVPTTIIPDTPPTPPTP